jgi:hypothetical protein
MPLSLRRVQSGVPKTAGGTALWRAVTRYSVLRRVMTRIIAERRDGFDLAQLFGVARDRFAADEKLIATRTFDAHAIQMSLLAKPLN